MDKTTEAGAIQKIVLAAAQPVSLKDGAEPFVVIPAGYAVESVVDNLDRPTRHKGTTVLHDAASFIAFFNRYKTDESTIYASNDDTKITGILNEGKLGSPGWADHCASYRCPLSNEWKAWTANNGHFIGQIDFAEFIENNLPDIHSSAKDEPTAAQMLEMATNFKMSKKVNFSSGKRLDNGQVSLEYVEDIQGTGGAKGNIRVPERFFIAIPVFEGSEHYRIECRFKYRMKDGVLTMAYDMARPHVVLESAFNDTITAIKEGCGMDVLRGQP